MNKVSPASSHADYRKWLRYYFGQEMGSGDLFLLG